MKKTRYDSDVSITSLSFYFFSIICTRPLCKYSAIHVGSRYRTENRLKIQRIHKLNTNQKSNNAKHSKTKLPWFSRLLRHSARKRGGLILQRSRAHTVCDIVVENMRSVFLQIYCWVSSKRISTRSQAVARISDRTDSQQTTTALDGCNTIA